MALSPAYPHGLGSTILWFCANNGVRGSRGWEPGHPGAPRVGVDERREEWKELTWSAVSLGERGSPCVPGVSLSHSSALLPARQPNQLGLPATP